MGVDLVVCKLIFEELLSGIVVVKPEQSLGNGIFLLQSYRHVGVRGRMSSGWYPTFFSSPTDTSRDGILKRLPTTGQRV